RRLVDDSVQGLSIVHASVATSIVEQLERSRQRFAYYATKLSDYFASKEQPIDAYLLRSRLGDGTERGMALNAAIEASRQGDWRRGLPLAEAALEYAVDREGKLDVLRLILALIAPLEL